MRRLVISLMAATLAAASLAYAVPAGAGARKASQQLPYAISVSYLGWQATQTQATATFALLVQNNGRSNRVVPAVWTTFVKQKGVEVQAYNFGADGYYQTYHRRVPKSALRLQKTPGGQLIWKTPKVGPLVSYYFTLTLTGPLGSCVSATSKGLKLHKNRWVRINAPNPQDPPLCLPSDPNGGWPTG